MTIDITQVVVAVIGVLALAITTFVVPLLKKKLTEQQMDMVSSIVNIGVYAAEQIFTGTGRGQEKKEYVQKLLKEKGIDISLPMVDAAIEAAVKDLKVVLQ